MKGLTCMECSEQHLAGPKQALECLLWLSLDAPKQRDLHLALCSEHSLCVSTACNARLHLLMGLSPLTDHRQLGWQRATLYAQVCDSIPL